MFVLNVFVFFIYFSETVVAMINWQKDFVSSNSVSNHTSNWQIGLPLRSHPILLITRLITDRIGLHLLLLPFHIAMFVTLQFWLPPPTCWSLLFFFSIPVHLEAACTVPAHRTEEHPLAAVGNRVLQLRVKQLEQSEAEFPLWLQTQGLGQTAADLPRPQRLASWPSEVGLLVKPFEPRPYHPLFALERPHDLPKPGRQHIQCWLCT